MREHLVHCLENGNFQAFPKNHVGFASKNIKINTYKIEIDCECGTTFFYDFRHTFVPIGISKKL
jgi:hypothetical protein